MLQRLDENTILNLKMQHAQIDVLKGKGEEPKPITAYDPASSWKGGL